MQKVGGGSIPNNVCVREEERPQKDWNCESISFGEALSIERQWEWLNVISAKYKIIICGNADYLYTLSKIYNYNLLKHYQTVYLQSLLRSSIHFGGLNIWRKS